MFALLAAVPAEARVLCRAKHLTLLQSCDRGRIVRVRPATRAPIWGRTPPPPPLCWKTNAHLQESITNSVVHSGAVQKRTRKTPQTFRTKPLTTRTAPVLYRPYARAAPAVPQKPCKAGQAKRNQILGKQEKRSTTKFVGQKKVP